jgi:hypothetical protein
VIRYSAVLLLLVTTGWAGDHVRVILDNSRSMRTNDAPHLATLSVALLYDLANPDASAGDSFAVFTFDSTWPKEFWKAGPPPVQTGPRLEAHGNREAFIDQVKKVGDYDAWNTYYYPVLKLAIDDLKKTSGGAADRRIIVMITDGLPEDPDRNGELIRKELIPELETSNIRLYILAFGPEASKNSGLLHEILGGPKIGDLFVDSTGSNLLSHMIEIFSRSFGYTAEHPSGNPGPVPLDLEGGQHPSRVAVISYRLHPKAPRLKLQAPPGGSVNNPEGVHAVEVSGSSFSLGWFLNPGAGIYTAAPDAPSAEFAVLRPARLRLEIKPQNPDQQIRSTMARIPFPLRVLVRPASGARGDPGAFDFSYKISGPLTGSNHEWEGNPEGGTSVPGPDGRTVDIAPVFPADQQQGRDYYEGWVSVELRRREAIIGRERHRVLVYPFFHLTATPGVVNGAVNGQIRSLAPYESACADFQFKLDGTLPHPGSANYTVRAALDPAAARDPRLSRARFMLDDKALEIQGVPSRHPGEWYNGLPLQEQELLGNHRVCMQAGRSPGAEPGRPLEVPIQFSLIEAPYDNPSVIDGVMLTVSLKSAGFFKENECWIALAGTLLVLGFIAWYGRKGPRLPSNLQLAVGAQLAEGSHLSPSELVPISPLLHFLGINRQYRIHAENGLVPLGRIAPAEEEIYEFIPARGVHLSRPDGEKPSPEGFIAVRQRYLARCERGVYEFLLKYR